jgi:thiamine kinase-like enzyme
MHEKINSLLEENLGCQLIDSERIGGGKNNQILKLTCDNGMKYVAKCYLGNQLDKRDRIGVEFQSSRFMWSNDIKDIPRAYFFDRKQSIAVYEYIDGTCFLPEQINEHDIDAAVNFLGKLEKLKNTKQSIKIPNASEAFFSVNDIIENIKFRKAKLDTLKPDNQISHKLQSFLENDFSPFFVDLVNWSRNKLNKEGLTINDELIYKEKTLSPSDFGFHNAIKKDDDQIVFLDFEYFGWDDPAKMVSDFLLHPNPLMQITNPLRNYFLNKIIKEFENYPKLMQRVKILHPFFGLKWCLIILNEFVPEFLSRREFADNGNLSRELRQMEQLTKSKTLLEMLRIHYKEFTYYD